MCMAKVDAVITTKSNLQSFYDNLNDQSLQKIFSENVDCDHHLLDSNDDRRGITLIIRPPAEFAAEIACIIEDLFPVIPEQYLYPISDLHITVLSIISCTNQFKLHDIQSRDYIDLIRQAIKDVPPFTLSFEGIITSPSALLIKGYSEEPSLQLLRNKLRDQFKVSGLRHSIDSRYPIQTAHMTFLRYVNPIADIKSFSNKLEQFESAYMGSFQVNEMELVFNDWYQRKNNQIRLRQFPLG